MCPLPMQGSMTLMSSGVRLRRSAHPPYMGASNMNSRLSDFIKKYYADYKSDYFSAFMMRCTYLSKPSGFLGFFSPYVWMFIQSYEKLRNCFCNAKTIETLIQFEYSAFEEATVPVCTFTLRNCHIHKNGCYSEIFALENELKALSLTQYATGEPGILEKLSALCS